MTIEPGEYADVLRSLGQVLERERAEQISITCEEDSLSASWRGQGLNDREEIERQLSLLHEQAKMTRMKPGRSAKGSLAEVLRTLGQDLDQGRVGLVRIVQIADGWTVTCSTPHGEEDRTYATEELLQRSRGQSGRRRRPRVAQPEDTTEVPAAGLAARTGPITRRILRREVP